MEKRTIVGGKDIVVEVDGKQVFTAQWVMGQMQALMNTNAYNRQRTAICGVFTAISVLLSLAAIVIDIAL